jgi:ribosomal protein S18 acetylase RimI-like enzyme
MPNQALLDNPVYASLSGPHAAFAQRRGRVCRYPADMVRFLALPLVPTDDDWRDAIGLVGPDDPVATLRGPGVAPDGWRVADAFEVVQMVGDGATGARDPDAVALGHADVAAMTALVRATNPGPFASRTVELGDYYGIRRDGQLVAMAGERLHPAGWTEISAVCTAATHRGQGLAKRLIGTVLAGIEGRSERAFLHTGSSNTAAIGLYESLGFRVRRTLTLALVAHD